MLAPFFSRCAAAAAATLCLVIPAAAQKAPTPSAEVVKELAPTGRLRAAINLGNSVLAQGTKDEPRGLSVDLARELAKRVNLPIELIVFDAAGKVFEANKQGVWDIAFMAREPQRAAEVEFTTPYVLIEGTYLVLKDSPLKTIADVDKPGHKIAVGRGSAYDLFLTRNIKSAQLVRAATGGCCQMVEMFLEQKLDAAAGVKAALVDYAALRPNLRVMDGRFQVIEQAMGTPKGRLTTAVFLKSFIEEMKASGFVAEGLKRSNQTSATIAPPM